MLALLFVLKIPKINQIFTKKTGSEDRSSTLLVEGERREGDREKKNRQKQKKKKRRQRRWGTDFTLARPSAVVWYEPSSAGVRLGWAHLTGMTPRPSHCGAAQSLCAHNACELALTHLVMHRGEARPSTVICRGKAGVSYWGNISLALYFTCKRSAKQQRLVASLTRKKREKSEKHFH